jgi:hypothetical protein
MRHQLLPLVAALALAAIATPPARAGEVTAESIWDRDDATRQALRRLPPGARVRRTRCQLIGVRGNDRYRCTVFYADPPAAPQGSGEEADPADAAP